MPRIRYYIAATLDGFVADAAGGVAWLDRFDDPSGYGYEAFYRDIRTLIMGRATYDQVCDFGEWPYDGKPAYVVTRRPLPEKTLGDVTAVTPEALPDLARTLKSEHTPDAGDIWLVGGPATAAPLLQTQLVDTLELAVMPALLGDGISLFPEGLSAQPLQLLSQQAYADGVLSLVYAFNAQA